MKGDRLTGGGSWTTSPRPCGPRSPRPARTTTVLKQRNALLKSTAFLGLLGLGPGDARGVERPAGTGRRGSDGREGPPSPRPGAEVDPRLPAAHGGPRTRQARATRALRGPGARTSTPSPYFTVADSTGRPWTPSNAWSARSASAASPWRVRTGRSADPPGRHTRQGLRVPTVRTRSIALAAPGLLVRGTRPMPAPGAAPC
ncbi:hypothetical protein QJS66_14405 [Kocuria rhizophila]|nr:hypothetical protein QJS66_14405 [Kocuria rhizophila]